jgi:dienelactone hydrolase
MDSSSRTIDVVYPTDAAGATFPLISYAHGYGDGGLSSYSKMLPELASWGYVVAAPRACKEGCKQNCKSLPGDPSCFGNYYEEQLKVIEWSQTAAALKALPINATAGAGVAGHSMGGQATLYSAVNAEPSHNVKAAAMHHAYTHSYPAITSVPFAVFTGTLDTTAPPSMAEQIYNAKGAFGTRALVNKKGANHHEPSTDYNVKLATFTVAWFKLFVDGTPSAGGVDFHAQIYGTGADSLCGGGDGAMKECEVLP